MTLLLPFTPPPPPPLTLIGTHLGLIAARDGHRLGAFQCVSRATWGKLVPKTGASFSLPLVFWLQLWLIIAVVGGDGFPRLPDVGAKLGRFMIGPIGVPEG